MTTLAILLLGVALAAAYFEATPVQLDCNTVSYCNRFPSLAQIQACQTNGVFCMVQPIDCFNNRSGCLLTALAGKSLHPNAGPFSASEVETWVNGYADTAECDFYNAFCRNPRNQVAYTTPCGFCSGLSAAKCIYNPYPVVVPENKKRDTEMQEIAKRGPPKKTTAAPTPAPTPSPAPGCVFSFADAPFTPADPNGPYPSREADWDAYKIDDTRYYSAPLGQEVSGSPGAHAATYGPVAALVPSTFSSYDAAGASLGLNNTRVAKLLLWALSCGGVGSTDPNNVNYDNCQVARNL